jgi:predicted RNA-binding protein with PUA-like domain
MSEKAARRYWLMKSEPDVFSFRDLLEAPGKTTFWEGVRNYQARNFMRDLFKKGDGVLFYHSNTDEPGVVGTAVVVREGYPDSLALDAKSPYFDAEAKKKGVNPWIMVDVRAEAEFRVPVTRDRLAAEPKLKEMMVLRKGSRLSVQPVTAAEFETVVKLGRG